MSTDNSTPETQDVGPYEQAAHTYRERGWHNPFPVIGKKVNIPKGYTGEHAKDVDDVQVRIWISTRGRDNITIRAQAGTAGVDIDHGYSGEDGRVKWGDTTRAEMEEQLGPLPATYRSTSRGADNPSGIRWYRTRSPAPLTKAAENNIRDRFGVPVTGSDKNGQQVTTQVTDIDIIRPGHRHGVVHPSIHVDTGARYEWYDPFGMLMDGPPNVDDLPYLPETWENHLRAEATRPDNTKTGTGDGTEAGTQTPHGAEQAYQTVLKRVGAGVDGQHRAHVTTAGIIGGRMVAADLRTEEQVWDDITTCAADGGWRHGDSALRVQIRNGIRDGKAQPWEMLPDHENETAGAVVLAPGNLPDEFWQSRPSLQLIRDVAHHRGRSADAALGGVLARYAATAPLTIGPDTGIGGGRVSLNFFAAAVGRSGAGKSSGLAVATRIVPTELDLYELPMGSGEGMAEAYMGTVTEEIPGEDGKKGKSKQVRKQVRNHALLKKDEGAELVKVMERQGSTIGEALRSAWMAETLGQQNGRADTTRILPAGSYGMGITFGFQEEAAAHLFSEEHVALGTVQRIVWFNAEDPNIPDEQTDGADLPRLAYPYGLEPMFGFPMTLPDDILQAIWREDRDRNQGRITVEPLNSHKPLTLIKVACLLALIEGRIVVTHEDWSLAEMVWATSCTIRQRVQDGQRERARQAEINLIKRTARLQTGVQDEVASHASEHTVRVAGTLARVVHKGGPITPGVLRGRLGRDRNRYAEAVAYAADVEWVAEKESRIVPGPVKPPARGD